MWTNAAFRSVLYQVVAVLVVGFAVWYLVSNTIANLSGRNIQSGFGFLSRQAGYEISESLIRFSAAESYGRAIVVGILNTLKVAFIGIILATLLGTIIGIARLSTNWLVARIAAVYVETMRNIPLLLQLFIWYSVITEMLPSVRQALNPIPGVFLTNRGLKLPAIVGHPSHVYVLAAFLVGIVLAYLYSRWAARRQAETGVRPNVLWPTLGMILGLPLLVFAVTGAHLDLEVPELRGFNFVGGLNMTPEFAALTAGLVVYTAAFIAEIVRAGILAVSKGQTEAAYSLGLRPGTTMRLVVLPQALRVIVPPMTSQFLNLTKNSSLAVAIGYPDIVSIVNTNINQTGQAVEGVAIIMAAYLTVSLTISLFMNWYNRRIALVER